MIIWSPRSIRDLDSFLDYLHERSPSAARKARADIDKAVERLSRRPHNVRTARWPGLRECSLTKWRKIIVFRTVREDIEVVAIYDARQDLTKVSPDK
jgi:plasmid stabilization system protein ParE